MLALWVANRIALKLEEGAMSTSTLASSTLDLLDWKRRVFELYARVRTADRPEEAWRDWRETRDDLFATHSQSPLPGYRDLSYYEYDPEARVLADVVAAPAEPQAINGSARSAILFRRFGLARFELFQEERSLELYWLEGYGGGVFLPFLDGTSGRETYGGGRYLLDTVKGSDLGMADGRLVLDFNFAYNPSCAYDGRWACPLAPAANRLELDVTAGERVAQPTPMANA
jgi:hypothetical protein